MKVASKFALAFLATAIVSLLSYAFVVARFEAEKLDETELDDIALLGEALVPSVVAVWLRDGLADALELVSFHDRATHYDARLIWLDEPPAFRSDEHREAFERAVRGETGRWLETLPGETRRARAILPLKAAPSPRPAALSVARTIVSHRTILRGELREQGELALVLAVTATAVASLLGWLLITRPLALVAARARRIGQGDLGRLEPKGRDEIADLHRELDAMCDALGGAAAREAAEAERRVQALEQLRHADRLRTVGQLASGIAHELGTPLNVIWMRAKMIASGETPPDAAADDARVIAAQTERVTKIVRQLLDFARRKTPRRATVDLRALAERVVGFLAPLAKSAGVSLAVEGASERLDADVDGAQLEQALTNLIVNALHASPSGAEVVVRARREGAARDDAGDATEHAVLEVEDHGAGIAAEHLDRLFEPFFTTKGVGEGTGLGLPVTQGIAEDHGGFLRVTSELGKGSRFTLYLPGDPR